jgi:hypothetical protein
VGNLKIYAVGKSSGIRVARLVDNTIEISHKNRSSSFESILEPRYALQSTLVYHSQGRHLNVLRESSSFTEYIQSIHILKLYSRDILKFIESLTE